jgi:hypothetical protein
MNGLTYAIKVHAEACNPGDFVNMSSTNPNKKLKSKSWVLLMLKGSQRINRKYNIGTMNSFIGGILSNRKT